MPSSALKACPWPCPRAPKEELVLAALSPAWKNRRSLKLCSQDKPLPPLDTAWRSVFGSAPSAPLCRGHREPCRLMTVKKAGPNKDRQFWKCARPGGSKGDKLANCDFFQWAAKMTFKKKS